MDTSDPGITFDSTGVCSHCRHRDQLLKILVHPGEEGKSLLHDNVDRMKLDGKGKDYDCIIGVSGGVDSSYVAYLVRHLGLRPLAIHLDNGWDSELAVKNIQILLEKLGIDLYTHVLEWQEFRDLQLAFLKSSTPDSEVPTDHAIVALLYKKAEEEGIKYIVNGCNVRTETHVPLSWSYGHMDWKYIYGVKKQFGSRKIGNYPHFTYPQLKVWRRKFNWFSILNYVDYSKVQALKKLEEDFDWRYYGGKHYESLYTKFYQGYILRNKFGYDKRRSHLSALICAGETTREKAIEELKKEPYPLDEQMADREYVIKKLEITEKEFESIMALPPKTHLDYPNTEELITKIHANPIYPLMQSVNRKLKIMRQ
jgi:N-acetyl sugar amidotransferase